MTWYLKCIKHDEIEIILMKWIRIGSAGCSSDFYRDLDLSEILGDPEITATLYIIFAVTSWSPSSTRLIDDIFVIFAAVKQNKIQMIIISKRILTYDYQELHIFHGFVYFLLSTVYDSTKILN